MENSCANLTTTKEQKIEFRTIKRSSIPEKAPIRHTAVARWKFALLLTLHKALIK